MFVTKIASGRPPPLVTPLLLLYYYIICDYIIKSIGQYEKVCVKQYFQRVSVFSLSQRLLYLSQRLLYALTLFLLWLSKVSISLVAVLFLRPLFPVFPVAVAFALLMVLCM